MPTYDVFLSHATADKPAVEALARRLRDEEGLHVFFDDWELVPGAPWQEALEKALADSRTCAIFLGPEGLGPWHSAEMRVALGQRVAEEPKRVIPVLLPGAAKDAVPGFLAQRTWVDFRDGLDDVVAYGRLVAGVRGVAPGGKSPPSSGGGPPPGAPAGGAGAGKGPGWWRNRSLRLGVLGLIVGILGALLTALAWLWPPRPDEPASEPASTETTAPQTPGEPPPEPAPTEPPDPDAGSSEPAAKPESRLGGTVIDADNRGVAGARITVRGHAAGDAVTDRDGRFELTVEAAPGQQVRVHVEHSELGRTDTYCFTGSLKCAVVLESTAPREPDP